MKANSVSLLRHACNVMEHLEQKSIGESEAKAQANLIKQANNLLRYELDRALALKKYEDIVIREIEEIEELSH